MSEKKISHGRGQNITKKIVFTAMFTALAVVVNAFFKFVIGPNVKYSINLTVYLVSGAILGGPLGLAVGVIGDVIGFLISPDGTFNPLITLSEGLFCFIPGVIFQLKNKFTKPKNQSIDLVFDIISIILSYVLCFVVCTCLLTSAGLWLYIASFQSRYETFGALVAYRALNQLPNTAVNLALSIGLYAALKKTGAIGKVRKQLGDKDTVN